MCDLHTHMYRYDRAEVVLTLFGSISFQSYAVESQFQTADKRSGNVSCRKGTATAVRVGRSASRASREALKTPSRAESRGALQNPESLHIGHVSAEVYVDKRYTLQT
jgi:hypothetical protein